MNAPLLRIVIPFLFGLVISEAITSNMARIITMVLWAVLFTFITLNTLRIINLGSYRSRWISGVVFTLLYGFTGYLLLWNANLLVDKASFQNSEIENKNIIVVGVVNKEPEEKEKTIAVPLKLIGVKDSIEFIVSNSKALLYIRKDPDLSISLYDTIAFRGILNGFSNNGNPYEFDYASFMKRKGFTYRAFVESEEVALLGKGDAPTFKKYIGQTRKGIKKRIFSSSLDEKNKGLALAMLLGDKASLDEEIREGFSTAGTIHILCVSGLHAGIIFLLISTAFGWLNRFGKKGKLSFLIIASLSIWLYAAITGFTPSVNRASLMMTFILLGNYIERKVNPLNNVAGAALLLLVFDPLLIKEMGFQLSFLAVAGILLLFKPISVFWNPSKRVFRYLRDLAAVSICAQSFTLPIILATFGTFPVWFLPANMLVIPITSFTMYAGVAFIAFPGSFIGQVTTAVFNLFLNVIRFEVDFISALPYAKIEGIFIPLFGKVLLFVVVISIAIWLNKGTGKFLLAALAALLIFLIFSGVIIKQRDSYESIVIYNTPGVTVADFVTAGKRHTVLCGEKCDSVAVSYAAGGLRLHDGTFRQISVNHFHRLGKSENLLVAHPAGDVLFVEGANFDEQNNVTADIAVIVANKKPFPQIFEQTKANIWIVGGSVKWYYAKDWQEEAQKAKVKIWITSDQGAFVSIKR